MANASQVNDGEPLPPGTLVFRVAKDVHLSPEAQRTRTALPAMFELSSADKASQRQTLSVWVEELTIPDQAWAFLGSKPEYTVVACLGVDSIRSCSIANNLSVLDVIRDDQGLTVPVSIPGANGHSGIVGLQQGDKTRRALMRSVLADIAEISPVPVPHDISDADLQVAAYFIYEAAPGKNNSEHNWIAAIRQLRRTRVFAARTKANEQAQQRIPS